MGQKNRKHLDEWILLWRAFELFYFRFLKKYNLSLNSFHVLTLLSRNPGGLEPSLLAERLGIMRQALTPLLNGLEKKHYLTRQSQVDDHRRKKIVLTPSGLEFITEVEGSMSTLELKALGEIPDAELDLMFEVSNRFHKLLSAELDNNSDAGAGNTGNKCQL